MSQKIYKRQSTRYQKPLLTALHRKIMELIFDKFGEQTDLLAAVSCELINLAQMEDEALVDEIEHLIAIVPQIDLDFDVLPVIMSFHGKQPMLSKTDRKLLEGTYILGHLNMGLDAEGVVAKVETW